MNYNAIIGIDVSKLTLDVFSYEKKLHRKFSNTPAGYVELLQWVSSIYKEKKQQLKCFYCFEHTGVYSLALAIFLQKKQQPFSLIPALEIKRSLGIVRGKSDKIDSIKIAQYVYLRRDSIKESRVPNSSILRLQPLLTLRAKLVKDRAGYITTQNEQGLFFDKKEHKDLFKSYQIIIASLKKEIQKIEAVIEQTIMTDAELKLTFELITSIVGVGPVIATNLIVTTHNFTRFMEWRQFSCYAGMAPFEYQSGTSIKKKTRVNHLANKDMKTLIHLGAQNAARYDPELKIYYIKRIEEGKSKMSTLNIIGNKMLARIFAVVKRQTPFVNIVGYAA